MELLIILWFFWVNSVLDINIYDYFLFRDPIKCPSFFQGLRFAYNFLENPLLVWIVNNVDFAEFITFYRQVVVSLI